MKHTLSRSRRAGRLAPRLGVKQVDRREKRSWLGRRVWIASAEKPRQYGTICSVAYRALASLMIRLDGFRGAVLVEEMARGRKWDFEKDD
jgi:hypothetical protein